ncbi:MAG: SDR family NAD(P)-dependent oxidoreductase [Muribaculaceae bacterium]|nr:SDR family NAD(P)-dependent oxidoreductase [Muribaculaceae bacterium]
MNILIIGATSGIGNYLWKHYSSTGNLVAVMGRRAEELKKMIKAAPDSTLSFPCDIADLDSFNKAFDNIIDRLNTLDLMIVCAGVGELNPELDIETELYTLRVNVEGWTNCVDAVYNQFIKQSFGHLVTITSVGGLQPTPLAPSYSASKAFQINYTKSLQKRTKGTGTMITEIRPGLIDTRMAKGDGLFWIMKSERVASSIVKAIEKRRKRLIIDYRWRLINFLLKHF